jgi:small-conductance mechanosensitive channel
MKQIPKLVTLLIFITALAGLLAGFTGVSLAQTDTPDTSLVETPAPPTDTPNTSAEETPVPPTDNPEPENTKSPTDEPTITQELFLTATPTPTRAGTVTEEGEEPPSSKELFTIEGPITQWVSDFAARNGLDQIYFLGLSVEDWINLALSILFFLLIYIFGKLLIYRGLKEILKRTSFESDEALLDEIRPQINWFMLTIALQISLARLSFLSSGLRVLLNQAFFVAYLTIITVFLWKVVGFGMEVFLVRDRTEEDIQRLQPIYMVVKRLLEALLIVGYASIMLSYFGIDITAFAAALGIGGLAISLAAQDTLADAIAGFLILLDQPFRVGDRIEISGLGTWGDVVEIGTRSTRIRTRDNRLVIVPNSAIAKDQVVNYTYPDPRYRVQIEVGIDYDSDLKLARETAIEAVRHVEGVLLDKPIDALFVDFGDTTIIFRIRWWIDSYIDTRRMFDKVNEALLKGFNEANIKMPNITYDLNLKVDDQNVKDFSEAIQKDRAEGKPGETAKQE